MDFQRYISELRNFGLDFLLNYHVKGRWKGARYKQQVILNYISHSCNSSASIPTPVVKKETVDQTSQPIWVCWWQGEEQMPEIVKACYHSLLKHRNGHPVFLLSKDNYQNYVLLPTHIEALHSKGVITMTHLSDILRFALLSKYGGLWMDATLFLTGDLPAVFPYLFTLKQPCKDECYVSDYRWSGYCIGGSVDNFLFKSVYDMWLSFWDSHDRLIDYYFLDYIIASLYNKNEPIREMIDNVPYSNPDVHYILFHMKEPYDAEAFERICRETYIHKLSWKGRMNEKTKDGGCMTYYGYVINHNWDSGSKKV